MSYAAFKNQYFGSCVVTCGVVHALSISINLPYRANASRAKMLAKCMYYHQNHQ
jgi:hypothetical protein